MGLPSMYMLWCWSTGLLTAEPICLLSSTDYYQAHVLRQLGVSVGASVCPVRFS